MPVSKHRVRKPALDIRQKEQSDLLWTWEHDGSNDTLVVCFSGIGKNTDPTPVLNFASSATQGGRNSVLYIADPNRTWLNGEGLIEAICERALRKAKEVGATRIVTLGHSMGGFSALVTAGMLDAEVAIAFSPQLSIDPAVVPRENRWKEHRAKITDIKVSKAGNYMNDTCAYYVFFGTHQREIPQRRHLPQADNVKLFLIPGINHNSPQRIRKAGILGDVVGLAAQRRTHRLRLEMQAVFGDQNKIPAEDMPVAVRPLLKRKL